MQIPYDRSLQMRGLGIMMICLHNFIHNIFYIRECEFAFYPEMVEKIAALSSPRAWNLFSLFFSFWGWYGIVVFMFFSGYGLAVKYEQRGTPLRFWPFMKRNYVKLMLLMLIPWMLCTQNLFSAKTILQLTYTINLIMPNDIFPSVFWYFGLTLQFYLLYVFFHRYSDNRWMLYVSVVVLTFAWIFAISPPSDLHVGLRYNCPFWLPVFFLGIWFARGGYNSELMRFIESHRWLSFLLFFVLWAISSVVSTFWVLSPLFFLLLLIALFHTREGESQDAGKTAWGWGVVQRSLTFLGRISPGIFVCHPVVRMYANKAYLAGHYLPLITLVYVVVVIAAAAIYTPLYKKSLPVVLRWLKLDERRSDRG